MHANRRENLCMYVYVYAYIVHIYVLVCISIFIGMHIVDIFVEKCPTTCAT